MIQDVKLLHRTSGGTLVRSEAKIEYEKGRIWFVKSPFALKDEIKAMSGSKWHGYDSENPRQMWSVEDCQRNQFQLKYLMGEDVYAWFDQEVKPHVYTRPLKEHQKDLTDHFLTYHYGIMAAEMGCVDGDAVVHVNRAGHGFKITLSRLFYKFRGESDRGHYWDIGIPTYIRSLCGQELRLNQVINVLHKGRQAVVKVTLASGKSLRVTSDHELCIGYGQYRAACLLSDGDTVLSSGVSANGGLVCFVPKFDTVVSIEAAGETDVYDVVCAGPHRNFVVNGVIVHNCGKTLSAQEVMERSGIKEWWWIGPKTSLPNIQREFRKWSLDPSVHVEMMTYEALKRVMEEWDDNAPVPQGVIVDESSRCKGATSQRSLAVQELADKVRDKHSYEGYVIEMSGTPSPKSPIDWWRQTEIAWPGFLKEGSTKAMEQRLAFLVDKEFDSGVFKQRTGWRDDERKCKVCGEFEHEYEDHAYEPSTNEVAYLYERLKGLVIIKHKKDCLDLPEKQYRIINLKPNASTLRAAQVIVNGALTTITGLTLLRELSDGFQYREVADGTSTCTHCKGQKTVEEWYDSETETCYGDITLIDPQKVARLQVQNVNCPQCNGLGVIPKTLRVAKENPCPKDKALRELLDECEETGRIVVFAGFTGSVDRVTNLCRKEGWDVVRCDGRGFVVYKASGDVVLDEEPLDYWANLEDHQRVAFVSHPESGGMSLTLVESRMVVYWSNSYKPEYRTQSEDRIHRIGADFNKGCTIVDLIHLPTDQRVLDVIRENRRLELLTLGEITAGINWYDNN